MYKCINSSNKLDYISTTNVIIILKFSIDNIYNFLKTLKINGNYLNLYLNYLLASFFFSIMYHLQKEKQINKRLVDFTCNV